MRIAWTPFAIAAVLIASASFDSPELAAQTNNRERTVYVSAVDDKNEPVEGLGPDAFIVLEDGRRREILRVSKATEPIELAVLVDNSAAAEGEITFMREALAKFVTAMGSQHHITLITLAERPTVLAQYTSDTAELVAAAGRIFHVPGSGMTLLDGLYETSRGLRRRPGPRAVIVPVVTDGIEFTNRYSTDVVRELKGSGAALHAVGIGTFHFSNEHSNRERVFVLDEGPRATGGQRISLLAPHALASSLERLARELSNQYKVTYGRPDSPFNEGNVVVTSAKDGITMRGTPARGETGAAK